MAKSAMAVATKAEFLKKLTESVETVQLSQKAADEIFKATFAIILDSVKANGKFKVPNFGSFTLQKRDARWGRNPQKPEEKIKIKASKTMKFKPSSKVKETLTKK